MLILVNHTNAPMCRRVEKCLTTKLFLVKWQQIQVWIDKPMQVDTRIVGWTMAIIYDGYGLT